MRILTVSSRIPYPPRDGYSLAIWSPAAALSKLGHEIDLISFSGGDGAGPLQLPGYRRVYPIPAPPRACLHHIRSLLPLTGLPYPVSINMSADLASALKRLLSGRHDYDLVQFEHLDMTGYIPLARALAPATVYRAQNVEHLLFRQLSRHSVGIRGFHYRNQATKLRSFEQRTLCLADLCITPTAEDAERLAELTSEGHVMPIPYGVDTVELRPGSCTESVPGTILFTGRMDYPPNVDAVLWFRESVWPLLKQEHPSARFLAVGKCPSREVRALSEAGDFRIEGEVEDMTPWFHQAEVVVVPLRSGSGMRLKILEAMATGKAVVSTRLGAEGLGLVNGRELLYADRAEEFAGGIGRLLSDHTLRQTLGSRARTRCEKEFSLIGMAHQLEKAYAALLSRERHGGGAGVSDIQRHHSHSQ